MTRDSHTDPGARERRIRELIRSTGDVRADDAFRVRLKREFIEGAIPESRAPRDESRFRSFPPGWWALVPIAAAVLLFVVFWPGLGPSPGWSVVAAQGDGKIETDGQVFAADEPDLVARALGPGGRVKILDKLTLDLRLGDRLLFGLDEGADVSIPALPERGARGPLVAEVHQGELKIKTGPGFAGTELHIITAEGRTEIVGTILSVFKGDGYTCICVLKGTARVGADEASLEDVPEGTLKILFSDGTPPLVEEIFPPHAANLQEFDQRSADVFTPPE